MAKDVPEPEITYGEFPFELVYEMDGETVVVNDVYVCEYDGIGMSSAAAGADKYREWIGYVESTGEGGVILMEDVLPDGNLQLICSVGGPEYYMSDPDVVYESEYTPNVIRIIRYNDGISSIGGSDAEIEELMETYNIKIISWTFSDPIENTFE